MFSFNPPVLLRNRHLQTVISPIFRRPSDLSTNEPIRLEIQNGTSLFGKLTRKEGSKSIAIIYHGLGGHEDAPYVIGVATALCNAGFSVLRMRLRGAEQKAPAEPTIYHAGLTEDIQPAVDWAHAQGYSNVYLVGFSLSGNTILKWLGEGKKEIVSTFVVSPAVRLTRCAEMIDSPKNRLYKNYFLKKLRASIRMKAVAYPDIFDPFDRPEFFGSIRAFDENITAPLHGFPSAGAYYETASSVETLRRIVNPTAIVHSIDDPFVDSADLKELSENPHREITCKLFSNGGHVGFYEGPFRGYQVDRWVVDYFKHVQNSAV